MNVAKPYLWLNQYTLKQMDCLLINAGYIKQHVHLYLKISRIWRISMRNAIGIILLLLSSIVNAGTIDPGLESKIAKSDPNVLHPTLIFMRQQLDLAAMKHQHDLAGASLAERHRDVITSLQRIATESQPELLNSLEQAKSAGNAGKVRGFWITNMISAELNAAEIRSIAVREDVDVIYSDFHGELIKPIFNYGTVPVITRREAGAHAIRADSMWAHGYTGQGRLVCNIDTGVDGTHPALNHSWRGNNGHPATQCWLDTADPTNTFPHDEGNHGTHTMGTMCGRSTTTADTVGVAFDAEWIAARAIDVTGGNTAMAFQWAVDPDGDPNTIDDMPDVISNSWGVQPTAGQDPCPPSYYSLIDNCEAAGAVVVFAAGNEGPTGQSLRIPANRITTSYNVFSVGAIDGNSNSFPIASFSSRGPSQCDGSTIKPEVVAPGVNVRSSVPGGLYESNWSGTSMACPHIAGAVALLRQVNPNATVDTIKWALMHSARDLPLSSPNGEDNTYGWGIIDVNAARLLLPSISAPFLSPNAAYVVEPNDNYPDPGETISLFVRLINTGLAASNVAAVISTSDQYSNITGDSAFYGTIAQNDTARSDMPFTISFSPDTPRGRSITFDLSITADGSYQTSKHVYLRVGHFGALAIADHDTGNVALTISNFGRYGVPPDGIDAIWQGRGFRMPRTGANNLFEGAMLMGTAADKLSDCARDENQAPGPDFEPVSNITLTEPGTFATQEYQCAFNDQGALSPLGVLVTQRSYEFGAAPDNDYVIIEYTILNTNLDSLNGLLVAHYQDWDIPWGSTNPSDRGNFDRARNLGYEYNTGSYRGQQVLSNLGVFSFKALENATEVYPPHFTKTEKWNYMNAGTTDTAITTLMDVSIMITTGPYNIASGDSVVAAFALLGGTSLADLRTNADAALSRYATRQGINDGAINEPNDFVLSQNYPNPFNGRTNINFCLSSNRHVKLETFDILGQKVSTLVDNDLESGTHTIAWNCADLPSGLYFYKLSVGDKTVTKKMTLLK
jgi:subtilisin family serine protease